MENEIRDIIRQLRELAARLEALLPQEQDEEVAQAAEIEVEEEAEVQPEPQPDPQPQALAPISFTINDRYRFRRELFGNSDAQMGRVVAELEALQSEAETIARVEALGWDTESPDVKDFIAAVTERFKASPTLLA